MRGTKSIKITFENVNKKAPIGLVHRDEIIEELYKEIKARSYDDIIKDKLMKALRLKLVPYFCLKDINIEFNFIWTLEADEEYEYEFMC